MKINYKSMEKNSEPSKTFTHMVKRFLTKVVRPFSVAKTISPKKCWENLASICQGMRLSSAQSLSRVQLFVIDGLQHARPSRSPPPPGEYSNSCPLSCWSHPTVSSSVDPFCSHLQSFPASGSFQMRQLITSGGQITGVSASASVLPPNIQNWLPLGWTRWISLQSNGLSKVFFNTTVQKHQLSRAQLSL